MDRSCRKTAVPLRGSRCASTDPFHLGRCSTGRRRSAPTVQTIWLVLVEAKRSLPATSSASAMASCAVSSMESSRRISATSSTILNVTLEERPRMKQLVKAKKYIDCPLFFNFPIMYTIYLIDFRW